MAIDIVVGLLACLIVVGLIFYFIWNSKRGKRCNCVAMKQYKKNLKKAKKEIVDKKGK